MLLAVAVTLNSCSDSAPASREVNVVPLYDEISRFNDLDSASRQAFMNADSAELSAFMSVVSGEPVTQETVGSWAASQAVAVFTPMVDSVFRPGATGKYIGEILGRADAAGLEMPERRYAEVVYGRPESILFVDSVMLIAMNHYLGSDCDAYSHLPQYMRFAKSPRMLPFDIAEAMAATSYPYRHTANSTVLSRLLYEGALANVKIELTGDDNVAQALGYTDEQYRWLMQNEKTLWRELTAKGMLFDTSDSMASKLVDPAPSVGDLEGAPGRVGRFIGFRMVKAYIAGNKDKSRLAFLMSPDFYDDSSVLSAISYNP